MVKALERKDWKIAVYDAGILSHYYTDPIHPFHTGQSEEEANIEDIQGLFRRLAGGERRSEPSVLDGSSLVRAQPSSAVKGLAKRRARSRREPLLP